VQALMKDIIMTVLFIGVFPSTREGTLMRRSAKTRLVNALRKATLVALAPTATREADWNWQPALSADTASRFAMEKTKAISFFSLYCGWGISS